MIHPAEVKEFLNRSTDSHAWIKKISEADLDAELKGMGFKPADRSQPLTKHQKACILLCLAYPQFALWLDMGLGKTRIMLEVMNHLFGKTKGNPTILILVPTEEVLAVWEKQIQQWKINLPYDIIGNMPSSDKWLQFMELDWGFLVATYPGICWLLSKRVKGRKGTKLKLDQKAVDKFAANITAVIYDQSTKVGGVSTPTFRVCRAISKKAKYRFALAGRPFGKDPTPLWGQQWLVDHGETLGNTLGLFRAVFFTEKKGHFGGYDYRFDKSLEPDLADIMQHRSISYSSAECLTLPKVTKIREEVKLPEDAKAYYEKAVTAIRKAKGNHIETKNIFLRMRQLSSGFLGYKNDETGEKAQLTFPVNPKLERMLDLIENVPGDRKFVVFYEFTHSGRTIHEALTKMGIKNGWLWSGTKDSRGMQRQFDDDPKMRGLVVNWRKGAMGPNWQVANYKFFFESPVSSIDREEAERRCFRQGQKLPGFCYDMIAKGTVDARILDFHATGESLFKALLRDPYGIV
jgi:SNF2 family DNA or RNA helicase